MTPHIARVLTRLYSSSWRARYGSEFEAMLQNLPATPRLVLDLLPAALSSRRSTLAVAALVAGLLMIGASGLWHHTSAAGISAKPHTHSITVASACRTYSSVTADRWIARSRCLD